MSPSAIKKKSKNKNVTWNENFSSYQILIIITNRNKYFNNSMIYFKLFF